MANNTDSSSSSNYSKVRKKKKSKHKKEKKDKTHRSSHKRRRDNESIISTLDDFSGDNQFGPALPPHLIKKEISNVSNKFIGPSKPNNNIIMETQIPLDMENDREDNRNEEFDDIQFGPLPEETSSRLTRTKFELEKRALEMKIAAISTPSTSITCDETREEWMLELPEVGLKSGLAALSSLKRTFHQGKDRPDFSDRSMWTKTPGREHLEKTSTSQSAAAAFKREAQTVHDHRRDNEQEIIAREHKKKHSRKESLVNIHKKKLDKVKLMQLDGTKSERRPFSRDVDLKLNKIDSHQTKQIVEKAKILNTKFSTGEIKYL